LSKQAPIKKAVKTKKRSATHVPSGIAHVKATFNNTIVVITDPSGRVIAWASAGKVNFSGSRKSSAFAATVAAQDAAKVAMTLGMKEVEVNLKGPGAGRESAVRGLQSAGLLITAIRDTTPVPHNGCRARKRRRV
jgi:small subunit ribosomal protein S11